MDTQKNILKKRVRYLQKKPQPEQRTPEWFLQRQTRVTASEAASCLYRSKSVCEPYVEEFKITNFKFKEFEPLNPYETKEDYIIKKCLNFYGQNTFKDNPYTLWGKKYEEVANRLYSKIYNTKVHEFGLIAHPRIKWLAASPDGITEDGVMIEIKCPKSRKIDSSLPPLYYYVQVQIQLEVCNLDECDFLECEIEEISPEEFMEKEVVDKQDKGIILQINNSGPDPKFVYPPLEIEQAHAYVEWKNTLMLCNPDLYTPIYFFITKYNVIRIKRSKQWFNNVKTDIKNTWDIISKLQNNREDFEKYKESITMIKNKEFIKRYNETTCLIDDDKSMFFDMGKTLESIEKCMIDSTD